MPCFTPKDTIKFECILNDTLIKTITVNNNTPKKISYEVSLEGIKDFSIRENSISLEPGQKKEFLVKFVARISKPVTARITFRRAKESTSVGAPLVYDLKSKIKGRVSTERVEINDCAVYETKLHEIRIINPFERDAIFNLSIETPQMEGKVKTCVIPSFFITSPRIHIQAKKSAKITICYLPISFKVHTGYLVLLDERVGEL